MNRLARRASLVAGISCLGLLLASCASPGASPSVSAPPPGSPLSGVRVAMDAEQVLGLVGEPGASREYQLANAWNPFHWQPGTVRTDWTYPGEGRVVFARNRYSGKLSVMEVRYEPGGAD